MTFDPFTVPCERAARSCQAFSMGPSGAGARDNRPS